MWRIENENNKKTKREIEYKEKKHTKKREH